MLPSGTVTFLFTDIEGSTARWEANSDRMRAALQEHNGTLERVAAEYSGFVFKTVGDAYCIAFDSAENAAEAAMAAQDQLKRQQDPLMVRMALHTAGIQPTGEDYFGPPVNRVARLLAAANGGQTVMSEAARALLPSRFAVKDLGTHVLRDLLEPARIWQLGSGDYGSVRSIASTRNNLPLQTTSFVGREEEMEALAGMLEKSRLITLTGTGGTGKSRLALQFAAEHMDRFPDGVWFCELAPLPERDDVLRAVVAAVGAPDVIGTPHDRLVMYLAGKRALVILDNCEHVLDAASKVAESLVASCASLTILATSREPLGARGEAAFRVPSLPAPDPLRMLGLEDLERYGSTALFIDRLATAAPSYEIQPKEAATIAHICKRLDGIPLAIELAAARGRAMSLEHIEKRLDDRFRLLTGGSRNALSRQQTLRALIDWSVQLLHEKERRFFTSLSVFSGGWKLDAAEAICADDQLESWEVLDLLTALVDKSLVVFEQGVDRYRMLESVRQYALERLEQSDFIFSLRDRHAEHYSKLGTDNEWTNERGSAEMLNRFAADYENFRAAVEWISSLEGGVELALKALCGAFSGFHSLGRPGELERLIQPLLDGPTKGIDQGLLQLAEVTMTVTHVLTGNPKGLEKALSVVDRLDSFDAILRSRWRTTIGYALFCAGRFEEDLAFVRAARAAGGDEKDQLWYPYLFMHEANSLAMLGRFDEALETYERCDAELEQIGDDRGRVAHMANIIIVQIARGGRNDMIDAALTMNRRSTPNRVYVSSRQMILLAFAVHAVDLGEYELGAVLLGGGLGMRESSGVVSDPLDKLGEAMVVDMVVPHLASDIFEESKDKGRRVDWEPWFEALLSLRLEDIRGDSPQIPNQHLIR